MNPVLNHPVLSIVILAGAVSAVLVAGLILVTRSKQPTGKGAHEPITDEERQLNAVRARAHNRWQGATEEWSPKAEMPAPRPLDAHIDVFELERIAEADVVTAVERLEAARANRLRFEMEADAAKLRAVETDTIKKIRYVNFDPKEATQEISWSPEMAGRR